MEERMNEQQRKDLIERGRKEYGLSEEQIKVYDRPEFNYWQASAIIEGFKKYGLTMEQVRVYAKPEIRAFVMTESCNDFEWGLTITQVEFLLNLNLTLNFDYLGNEMNQVRYGFKEGLTMEQVRFYAKKEFDANQMIQIRKCYKVGLTMEQVALIANSRSSYESIAALRDCFKLGLSEEQVRRCEKFSDSFDKIIAIRSAILCGLSEENIQLLEKLKNGSLAREVFYAIIEGLDTEQINTLVKCSSIWVVSDLKEKLLLGWSYINVEKYAKEQAEREERRLKQEIESEKRQREREERLQGQLDKYRNDELRRKLGPDAIYFLD